MEADHHKIIELQHVLSILLLQRMLVLIVQVRQEGIALLVGLQIEGRLEVLRLYNMAADEWEVHYVSRATHERLQGIGRL